MALKNCSECGHQISTGAGKCPSCGARQTKRSTKLWAVFLFLFMGYVVYQVVQEPPPRAPTAAPSPPPPTTTRAPAEQSTGWRYTSSTDDISGEAIRRAVLESRNTVSFRFPYQNPQHGRLAVREHPRFGTDLMLSIARGQFMCEVRHCNITIRVDDDEPREIQAGRPQSASTTVVFLRPADELIQRLRTAETTRIEATFYQEGNRTFVFHTDGLDWPPQ